VGAVANATITSSNVSGVWADDFTFSPGYFSFYTSEPGGYQVVNYAGPVVSILQNADMGIGTITPSAVLQVSQQATGPGLINITNVGGSGIVTSSITGPASTASPTQFTNTFKVGDQIAATPVMGGTAE
jgi:hypothetical protein